MGAPDVPVHRRGPRAAASPSTTRRDRRFDALLGELSASGELVTAEALADPASATVYRWRSGDSLASEGPYAETQEHLAGFFLVDCATRERAEEVAAQFAGPGSVAELRPAYVWE